MNEKSIYIPVSLRLIKWTKETSQDGNIVQTPKQCYAHTTSQGRVMKVGSVEMNTTTTMSINGVDLSQKNSGLSYAKWYWDMNEDMYDSMLELGFGTCYIKLDYSGNIDNVINETLVSQEEYDSLQIKPSFNDYMQAQAV